MKFLIIAMLLSLEVLATPFPVPKFLQGEVGSITDPDSWGYEKFAWKLFQMSPSGSAMFAHSQRDFVIAIRKSKHMPMLMPNVSIGQSVPGCLKYVGSNSYKNLQGFTVPLRVYEVVPCK